METKSQVRETKRAQFSEAAPRKNKITPILVVVLVALIGGAAYLVVSSTDSKPAATAVTTQASGAGDVRIQVAELSGTAKFFDYKTADNKPVRFFVMKSSDGVCRAALDACSTCFHARKGYHQEGDDMVCNNCGLHFPSARINEVHGGCNPIPLPRAVEGDQLVIKAADLQSRSSYF
jgi:uncharacterized membrane protein